MNDAAPGSPAGRGRRRSAEDAAVEIKPRAPGEPEVAVLCGVMTMREERAHPGEDDLTELRQLARTAGAAVKEVIVQHKDRPDVKTYLGKGKVEELGMLLAAHDGNLVISDDDLSPSQGRNLERALKCRVVDRSQLILDIFARHARSKQARLQFELAQLTYTLPRLKRMWTHLERLGGGIGTRGPGETQIETDRRIIRKRLSDTRHDLDEIKARKQREVASRSNFFTVSLVGYTNAGKSTLHRLLTGSGVEVADKLFATLDTKTSLLELPGGGRALLSDTVGFIRKLPHHLVECFHATLEEARHADLLLHVVDSSHPDATSQMAVVTRVLEQLGLASLPTVLVLNKSDAVKDPLAQSLLAKSGAESVRVSAASGEGIPELLTLIRGHFEHGFVTARIQLPMGEGRWLARLEEHARIHQRTYSESGEAVLVCTVPRLLIGRLEREVGSCRWEPCEADAQELLTLENHSSPGD